MAQRIEKGDPAGYEAVAVLVAVSYQHAVHVHGLGDFPVVQGVADEEYLVGIVGQFFPPAFSVFNFTAGVLVVESDHPDKPFSQAEHIDHFFEAILLIRG